MKVDLLTKTIKYFFIILIILYFLNLFYGSFILKEKDYQIYLFLIVTSFSLGGIAHLIYFGRFSENKVMRFVGGKIIPFGTLFLIVISIIYFAVFEKNNGAIALLILIIIAFVIALIPKLLNKK
ncbi:hypothetical protein [Algoriphagus terrigena]|uniref:hypothetical protein n=1 Tax=Algoriphagus terrigena TaxID=344884 RepID=UPI00047B623D|nr:hypothetical protein [Algoriphagus terrigena]